MSSCVIKIIIIIIITIKSIFGLVNGCLSLSGVDGSVSLWSRGSLAQSGNLLITYLLFVILISLHHKL